MELLRQTVRKCVFDYLSNSQECTFTMHYGFASTVNRVTNVYELAQYVLGFWAPRLQNCLGDTGQVGGVRVYAPHERHRGSAGARWTTPGTAYTQETAVPGLAVLFRGLQTDVPQRIQKRAYIPIRTEAHLVSGLLGSDAATGAAIEAFRLGIFARLNVPTAGPPIEAIPCVPDAQPPIDDVKQPPRYYSLQDAVAGQRPAQRRSRQLRGQFAFNGVDLANPAPPGDMSFLPLPGYFNPEVAPPIVDLPLIPGLPANPEV